jgi:hypothetical protein
MEGQLLALRRRATSSQRNAVRLHRPVARSVSITLADHLVDPAQPVTPSPARLLQQRLHDLTSGQDDAVGIAGSDAAPVARVAIVWAYVIALGFSLPVWAGLWLVLQRLIGAGAG